MSQPAIVWRTNDITGIRTWTYGNWGGAGWSNGKFTPREESPNFAGPVISKLDETFRSHDESYQKAQDAYESSPRTDADKAAYWDAIIQADRDMLKAIEVLRRNGDLGNPASELEEASIDYTAGSQATIAFWFVLKEREKSRDRLADPRRLYEEGKVSAPPRQDLRSLMEIEYGINPDEIHYSIKQQTQTAATIPSPIILDLDGDGLIGTVGLGAGVHFDHAADGFAERTGWVAPGDGLLVWDRNANGTIDTGRELLGSETLLPNGLKAVNGFEALAALDANGDGIIDANDPVYAELRVWVDVNLDGRTGEGELLTLEEAGVRSISVAYTNSTHVDAQGNAHRQVGSYTTTEGHTRLATDVWFQADATYSLPTEWVEVPESIAALPDAQGYGKVRDLHQAMAMDSSGQLQALVTAFTQASTPEDRDALVTRIIYHWTGVQDVDPFSRASRMIYGNAIGDARKLEALEEFMGEEWFGVWCWGTRDANPHGRAAPVLLKAWDEIKALVYGQLMAQSHLKDLFQNITYQWDMEAETVVGDLEAVGQSLATQLESDREAALQNLGDFLHSLKGMGLLNRLDVASFRAMLLPLGADVAQTMETALKGWVAANGPTEGDDVLRGTEFNDIIDGRGGNDRLFGRGGDDILIGGAGNDVLDGGTGNDELRGGTGSDTYRFGRGDGHDTIVEDSWHANDVDRIELKVGITPDDVRLTRVRDLRNPGNTDDLVLTIVDTGETITVKRHFVAGHRHAVEEIVFADGTVWDVEEIRNQVLKGSDGDDVLHGFAGRDNVIEGGAGNDKLHGSNGNDTLDGGVGNDELRGGGGSDTYRFGRGDGHDTIIEDSWIFSDTDRIELKDGVSPDEVQLQRVRTVDGWQVSDDLVLTIADTGETITVRNHFNESNRHAVEEIVFADGTVWGLEDIKTLVLLGGDGDDTLHGFNGRDDVLDGGAGNDVLMGGTGSDIYRFGLGRGHNTVIETADAASEDVVWMDAGISPDDLEVRWTLQGDMVLTLPDGSSMTIKDQARPWAESMKMGIEAVRFANGVVWDRAELAARAIAGTAGDDVIVGGYGNDVLNGGPGNDHFEDLGGYDTYVFGLGDGHDVINDSSGRILFKDGIAPGDVRFSLDGADLVATLGATGDSVRVTSWSGTWQRMDRFVFADGTQLSAAEVLALLGAGADVAILQGTAGDDALTGGDQPHQIFGYAGNDTLVGGSGNDHLLGGDGNDVLIGGQGDDLLEGGSGHNVYVYNRGDGKDRILVQGGAEDTLRFGDGIRPEDVHLIHEEGASPRLVITLSETESVTVEYAPVAGAVAPGMGTGPLTPRSSGVVIDNGVIQLGVNTQGHLNVPYWPDPMGIGYMGLRYMPTGGASTEYGALAEGWGVSNGMVSGYANASAGTGGLSLMSFEANATSAVSVVGVGGIFDVTHAYKPSESAYLYEVEVTIRNVSGQDQEALYRRVMDWDIWPTPYYEYVTIVNSSPVVFRTDTNGFNSSNPLWFSSYTEGPSAANGYQNLIDYGPSDHGALFDFNFGLLAGQDDPLTQENETILRFSTYYGAAGSEAEALNALARVGAEQVYSLGQASVAGGAAFGVPNTFVFAFKGVGGEALAPARLIDRFEFADGRVFSLAELQALPASTGTEGDDLLEARLPGAALAGGVGSDTYRVHVDASHPGEVLIAEVWRAQDVNRIELLGDVDGEALHLAFDGDDLLLRVSPDHAIRFPGFDPRAPGMQAPVTEILLPDGSLLTFEELLARGVRYGEHTETIDDTYDIRIGDGEVSIVDVATADAPNTLRFGPGISAAGLQDRLSFIDNGEGGHWLLVHYGGEGDVLRLTGFNRDDVLGGGHAVEHLLFADGTVVDYATLVSWGFTVEGDEADNTLRGSNLDDRLHGGLGNDVLMGGDGNDAYIFAPGNGVDTIIDSGDEDFNFIRFTGGLTAADIRREWEGSTLLLHYGPGDTVRIENFFSPTTGNPTILALAFEDGTIEPLLEHLNHAPTANGELASASAKMGEAFTYAIPEGFFQDPDPNDQIRLTARLANGEALPDWLAFDTATGQLSGTPTETDLGSLAVVVTAMDHFGLTVERSFGLTIQSGTSKGGPKGNAGVGNGQDAPPPGRTHNHNDGPGTGPGNPGSKGGNNGGKKDKTLDDFLDSFQADAQTAKGASTLEPVGALDADWFERWFPLPAQAHENAHGHTLPAGHGPSVEAHWQQLLNALKRLDAERQDAAPWQGNGQGADLSGLAGLLSGNAALVRVQEGGVGLAPAGTQLKGFTGLREGVATLHG